MNKVSIIIIVIIVIIVILFICYLLITNFLFNKLTLAKNIIKSNLNNFDLFFLKRHSIECSISSISSISSIQNNILFYTDVPWSTKNDNHLLDVSENKYYIVDKEHMYYLDKSKDYKLFINSGNVKIRLFDFEKYHKKINYI
jgi:hypothetical protein